jgi:hypothetical protein
MNEIMTIQQLKEALTQVSQGVYYSSEGEERVEAIVYESPKGEGEISLEALLSTSGHLLAISLEQLQLTANKHEESQHLYDVITERLSHVQAFMLWVPDGEEIDPSYCQLEKTIVLGQFSDDTWIAITSNQSIDENNFEEDNCYSIDLDDTANPEAIEFASHLEEITTGFVLWENWGEDLSPDWLVITAPCRQGIIDKVIQKTRLVHQFPVTNLKEQFLNRLITCSPQVQDGQSGDSVEQIDLLEKLLCEQFSDFEQYYFGRSGEFILFLIAQVVGASAKGGLITHVAMT